MVLPVSTVVIVSGDAVWPSTATIEIGMRWAGPISASDIWTTGMVFGPSKSFAPAAVHSLEWLRLVPGLRCDSGFISSGPLWLVVCDFVCMTEQPWHGSVTTRRPYRYKMATFLEQQAGVAREEALRQARLFRSSFRAKPLTRAA